MNPLDTVPDFFAQDWNFWVLDNQLSKCSIPSTLITSSTTSAKTASACQPAHMCSWFQDPCTFITANLLQWKLFIPARYITAQFWYIEIQLNTIDLSMRLRGTNPTNSAVILWSLILRSIVLGWILINRNWGIILKQLRGFVKLDETMVRKTDLI